MRAAVIFSLAASAAAAALVERAAPIPTIDIPSFTTATWDTIPPTEAAKKLYQAAKDDPSAVKLVQGVAHIISDLESELGSLPDLVKSAINIKREAAPEPEADPASDAHVNVFEERQSTCSNPAIRVEWRRMSPQQRSAYTNAIRCLITKPARSGLANTRNRWDDLTAIHQRMANQIHEVGQFFAWHRYFVWMFEQELKRECGFNGPIAWWDETLDSGRFSTAPMFTPNYFGTLPTGNPQCTNNGAFGGLRLHIGPGTGNTDHCLSRACNDKTSASVTQSYVSTCQSYTSFSDMQDCIFYGVHGLGHNAIGAVMSDVLSSPGEPAFFLHHTFIDHTWRIWQNANSARAFATGGYTTQTCNRNHGGNGCRPTTLDYQLTSFGFYPAVTIRQVSSTMSGILCYKYDY